MLRLSRALCLGTLLALSASACMDDGKAPEEELGGLDLDDAKADSFAKPTDHGVIPFDTKMDAVLTSTERYHSWTFTVSADAQLDIKTTYTTLGQRRTDTVLYLYKKKANGTWGAYLYRNDDYGSTTYSDLKKNLDAGEYRIIVKGALASTTGKFSVIAGCSGDGCTAAADPNACVFGEQYHDIVENNPFLTIINSNKIHPDTLATLTAEQQHQLLLAVQQSAHTDVTTPEEAINAVDQDEVNVTWLYEETAKRDFIAFEYGAGDNSYGAVFSRTDGSMVTNDHDGDLENCTVRHETCLFPDDWTALKAGNADWEKVSEKHITAASQISGVAAQQAVLAFQQSDDSVTSVAAGLSGASDDHDLNEVTLRHKATGQVVDAYQFYAGDTAVGAVFYTGTTNKAAVISDLAFDSCTLFAAH
ncbi:MAG TPA: hypothetical protein VGM39_09465 [Kofleriaceae bacterium]